MKNFAPNKIQPVELLFFPPPAFSVSHELLLSSAGKIKLMIDNTGKRVNLMKWL